MLLFNDIFKSTSTTKDNSHLNNENMMLTIENNILKNDYEKLKIKLEEMEYYIEKIDDYDYKIYSDIIGGNFDTTKLGNFRNDSIGVIFEFNDSIFMNVEDRSLYAAELLALRLKQLEETSSFFKENKNAINYYPNISPIRTEDFIMVTSPYGWRKHPIKNRMLFHDGIDISANIGTPVYASAQGTVQKVLYSRYGYGNRVIIRHAYGFETLYAHLGKITVKKGQWVDKNQKIGTVGNTGTSTGPHLHYEIKKRNETRDPLGYFYTYLTNNLLASKE
ncbi:MAG: M23 family metallopeptidase [bacterium]